MNKKIRLLFSFLFLCHGAMWAKPIFQISPFMFLSFGKMGEYLYKSGDGPVCSYLEWEEKPLWGGGLEGKIKFDNFSMAISGSAGIPSSCGKMFDSDYFYTGKNQAGTKFIYSIHKADAVSYVDCSFSVMYDFPIGGRLKLSPVLKPEYTFASIKAHDGYGWYGNLSSGKVAWDSAEAVFHPKLYGIDFLRHEFNFWCGGMAEIKLSEKILLGINLFFAIWTYDYSVDEHHGVENPFVMKEYLSAYFSRINCGVKLDYKITEKISINLAADFLYGPERRGETYVNFLNSQDGFYESSQNTGSDVLQFAINSPSLFGGDFFCTFKFFSKSSRLFCMFYYKNDYI